MHNDLSEINFMKFFTIILHTNKHNWILVNANKRGKSELKGKSFHFAGNLAIPN